MKYNDSVLIKNFFCLIMINFIIIINGCLLYCSFDKWIYDLIWIRWLIWFIIEEINFVLIFNGIL